MKIEKFNPETFNCKDAVMIASQSKARLAKILSAVHEAAIQGETMIHFDDGALISKSVVDQIANRGFAVINPKWRVSLDPDYERTVADAVTISWRI